MITVLGAGVFSQIFNMYSISIINGIEKKANNKVENFDDMYDNLTSLFRSFMP